MLEWAKAVGEAIEADATIVEISTDKVDAEVPAPATGTLTEILAEAGETVAVGQVIGRIAAGAGAERAESPAPEPSSAPRPATDAGATAELPDGSKATPVARRVAAAHGIDLARVQGSGPAGRIGKDDVLAAANGGATATTNGAAPAAKPAGAQLIKGASAMLARYMDESRSVPTATSFRTITVTTLDARRKQLKEAGHKVSFTHLIAYAIARAATEQMPVMARHFDAIDGKPHVIDDGACNLGIAVDVERKDGGRTLMVPIIRDAGRLTFAQFLDAFGELIAKARENRLTADDLQGGNVSLTNPGGIGTIASVPRLMKGQGTIVATGSIGFPPGLAAVGAMIGAEKVMTMTSTYDHRIIQGAESGQFLQVVEAYLQGEHDFYEQLFQDLGAQLGAAPQPPAPAAAAAAVREAPAAAPGVADESLLQAVQAATSLLKAHRMHGHLAAKLDPLGSEPEGDPALDPETVGLTPELMARIPSKILRTHVPGATLADSLPHLRETYCGTIAYEIEHIASHRQRTWLREKIESGAFRAPLTNEEQRTLLRRLTQVDSLERFMHKAYLGQKQFSIEGLDMTVPMLDETIQLAAANGAREVVIGMAHRGRLNVLAHCLGRAYETIFREFEGASSIEAVTTIPQGGTGDVKYHHGAQGTYQLPDESSILVRLESNPSHLEYVGPVVEGATRAVQTTRQGPHAHLDNNAAIPIILHGDAAFPGQGVVAETFNLQGLDGYTVGGALHLIQNNQVGFTTDPDDSRSTRWASDLAKGFDVPIIHVNADDVAACVAAVRLAFAFRQEFGHDVLIDLIGYRRFGHNEADEPAYTQPEMAAKIKGKIPVRELYAAQLVEQGVVTQEEADGVGTEIWEHLATRHRELKADLAASDEDQPTGGYELDRSPSPEVKTAVSAERLQSLNEDLLRIPDGFTVHPKLIKQLERRRETVGPDGGIDWAHAETLAYASLLSEGTPIRLTGQDSERGTFSQRHLVLHDAKTGQRISPIQSLPGALAPMELHNSPLSEVACLGFEYGYSMEAPETLVLWEAQFGDFVNSAQVIIDQFIVSALSKWGQSTRLTLLLPHGYEGSGPEHSSGRHGALPPARRGGQHPRREPHHARPVLPPAAPPGARRQAAPAGDHDPEVAAAPAAGDVADRAPVGVALLPRAERAADRRGEGQPPRPVLRQDLLRPQGPRDAREQRGRRDLPRRAPVSVPAAPDPRRGGALPEPARGPVGAGGAAQHGRPRAHVAAPAAHPPELARVRLRRPARARVAGRGLPGRPHDGAEPHHPHRAGPVRAGVGEPGQAARRALSATAIAGPAARRGAAFDRSPTQPVCRSDIGRRTRRRALVRRSSSAACSARRTASPARGANSGESRSSSVAQPGCCSIARRTASAPASRSPFCAIPSPAQKSSSSDCGASSAARR